MTARRIRAEAAKALAALPDATPTTDHFGRFMRLAAIIAGTIASMTLIGLATGIDTLIRWVPTSTSMNPLTAVAILAGCTGLLLPARQRARYLYVAALVMIGIGASKLFQILAGHSLGIDQFVSGLLEGSGTQPPDPVAPNTAAVLVLMGSAIILARVRHPARAAISQALALAGIIIALMALVGFVLGAATINQLTFNRMAVNTAVALSLLGVAVLGLTRGYGVMRLLNDGGRAGMLARTAIPVCLVLPVTLGLTRLWGEGVFVASLGDGVALMIIGNIILSLALLWTCLTLLLRSETALRAQSLAVTQSEERYRIAQQIARTGHWEYDVARDQLHWTDEFRALLGLDADLQPDFEAMIERIHPDDRDRAREMMIRARTLGEDWEWHVRLNGADGKVLHAKSHGICFRSEDGSPNAIFGVLVDVTELEQARRVAEDATHAQAAFLANMSHEIRTPLNGVLGFIQLLMNSKLNATQRRYITLVEESAQILLKLLNDILDLSKIQAGHLEIAPHLTDLRRLISHSAKLMLPTAEQKGLVLTTEIDDDFPAAITIDSYRVRQILVNILGNALKFTAHGMVSVSLRTIRGTDGQALLRLDVTDDGIGIARGSEETLFKPFVQADNSTSRRFGGSGLGLSISRQLAERMGGTLSLEARAAGGTIATLILPLELADAPLETTHESDAVAGGRSAQIAGTVDSARALPGLSILVVEDFEINRELIGTMLEQLGHKVEFAVDGIDAVAKAGRLVKDPAAWDLILMDVQMPQMNGTDATRRIRALGGGGASIPILALSANAYKAEIEASKAAGMNDHLVKPIDFQILHDAIERWGRPERSRVAAAG